MNRGVFLLFLSGFVAAEPNGTWLHNVRIRRQSDSKNCILPPYPKNGQYTVGGQSSGRPGERYDAVQLHISCDPGYQPVGSNLTYCVFGDWSQDPPQCVRHCSLHPHPSVRYRCLVNSDDSEEGFYRNCEQHEPSGTIVKPECNKPNYYVTGVLSHMRCIGGRWNYVATCLPECGIITPNGKPLVIGGQVAERGEFPWHAGIYLKTTTPFKLICGGSLVTSTVVISAAHCFWGQSQQKPASDFAIALGKLYREWNNPLDDEVQKYDVVEVKMPVRYQSSATNYQDDIAAAMLSAPAQYRPHVRPVCLNLDPEFNAHQLHEGNLGKVAGWGLIDPQGTVSRVLRVLELPYVKIETCIAEAPSVFRPFITSDKICAGYLNGSAICRGDSGGGLVFPAVDHATERYYLRGIVSTAPQSDQECNAFARTTFTEIIKHRAFIEKNTIILDESSAPVDREPDPLCTLPPYPANGRYKLSGSPGALPGQNFLSAQLEVTCNEGYTLEKDVSPSCSLGRWHEDMPKCVEVPEVPITCTIPPNASGRIACSNTNDNFWKFGDNLRECNIEEPSGSSVRIDCASINIGSVSTLGYKVVPCINGKWVDSLTCNRISDCGLVVSGNLASRVAIIYKKEGNSHVYTCGATIINRFTIVTAARCLMTSGRIGDLKDFIVAAGKIHPKWNDVRDDPSYKQTAKIQEVYTVPQNRSTGVKENDMLFVTLSSLIDFNDRVQRACMLFPFDSLDPILRNNVGKTATWSIDEEDQTSLDTAELKEVDVRYVEEDTCRTEIGTLPENTSCFKSDASDGQGVSRSDTGMGLMYQIEGHYILVGYASSAFGSSSAVGSNSGQLAAFTVMSQLGSSFN